MKLQLLSTLLLLSLANGRALAWDTPGHEQIADMAYTLLSDDTKASLREILKHGEGTYRPADESDEALRDAFRRAANFPDRIKGDTHTSYETEVVQLNLKWQPHVQPQQAKGELARCKTWHYYDTPIRFQGQKPEVRSSNALVAYTFATKRLKELKNAKDDASLRDSAWWLYWIEHITGDLHQPLHCTSDYETNTDKGDAGGNEFFIHLPNHDKKVPLHSYWDEGIDHATGEDRSPIKDVEPAAAKHITELWMADPAIQPSQHDKNDLKVADWIADGAKLADQSVYVGIKPLQEPDQAYLTKQIKVCKPQAVLAAYRLAAVLNGIYSH